MAMLLVLKVKSNPPRILLLHILARSHEPAGGHAGGVLTCARAGGRRRPWCGADTEWPAFLVCMQRQASGFLVVSRRTSGAAERSTEFVRFSRAGAGAGWTSFSRVDLGAGI